MRSQAVWSVNGPPMYIVGVVSIILRISCHVHSEELFIHDNNNNMYIHVHVHCVYNTSIVGPSLR